MRLSPGKRISFTYKEQQLRGIVLSEEKGTIVMKLDSGYNISCRPAEIKNVQDLKVDGKKQTPKSEQKVNPQLPRIAILHTGGTIASKVDYETGGVISRYSAEEILDLFPEMRKLANVTSRLMRNMWSEDMRFSHYNLIAEEVRKELEAGAAGVIITHGTDTLHYTSAALSFILENLNRPVLLVGAQRSSDRGSGDAAQNLLAAVTFITREKNFADVGICMHEQTDDDWCSILPGTKCRKLHSSRRDAFKPVNTTAWARVNPGKGKIELLSSSYRKPGKGKLDILPFKEGIKVALLKVHTNMYASQFEAYKGYKGLLIEGTGIAGNIPINEIDKETKENGRIRQAIVQLIQGGTLVAAASQTIYGRIDMNVYSTGREMQEIGIIGNYTDMTPETAFVKLAWLLSNQDRKEAKRLYGENLRGEITARSQEDGFRP